MPRKYSASQFRSQLRQAQQKQQQAVNKYNQAIRQHNQNVKNFINKYNQEVRSYNARVRANRQRIKNELERLNRQSKTTMITTYVVYRASVEALHNSYAQLESRAASEQLDDRYNHVLDLSERETANSLEVTNRILGNQNAGELSSEVENIELLDSLRRISPDLDDRWKGAVFALDPRNPDAARHFCTSSREIITKIIDLKAPDADVFALFPTCERTDRGNPTRRSKIKFFLYRQGMMVDALEEFVEKDMENILQLFRIFNDGTHGSAGTFDFSQLKSIKKRVEDGITFLTEIIEPR